MPSAGTSTPLAATFVNSAQNEKDGGAGYWVSLSMLCPQVHPRAHRHSGRSGSGRGGFSNCARLPPLCVTTDLGAGRNALNERPDCR